MNRLKFSLHNFLNLDKAINLEEKLMLSKLEEVSEDSKVTIENFLNAISSIYGVNLALIETERLSSKVIASKELDYEHYTKEFFHDKILMTDIKLHVSYEMFDKDKNGVISASEMQDIFGGELSKWKLWVKIFDIDFDEELSFDEFKRLVIAIGKFAE